MSFKIKRHFRLLPAPPTPTQIPTHFPLPPNLTIQPPTFASRLSPPLSIIASSIPSHIPSSPQHSFDLNSWSPKTELSGPVSLVGYQNICSHSLVLVTFELVVARCLQLNVSTEYLCRTTETIIRALPWPCGHTLIASGRHSRETYVSARGGE